MAYQCLTCDTEMHKNVQRTDTIKQKNAKNKVYLSITNCLPCYAAACYPFVTSTERLRLRSATRTRLIFNANQNVLNMFLLSFFLIIAEICKVSKVKVNLLSKFTFFVKAALHFTFYCFLMFFTFFTFSTF